MSTRSPWISLKRMPALDHPLYGCILAAAVGAFLLASVRNGIEWDGDDALYIMNARNIVLGLPYANTGYLVNPDNVIHPAAYPPGFPLLLAPIIWLFGISFAKMKAMCVVCFAVFIATFVRIAQRYVSPGLALATAAAIGLNPYIFVFKNTLYSELPFMLMCYGALFAIDVVQRDRARTRGEHLTWLAGAAVLIAFAYLIRAIGIVIFPAALLSALQWRPVRLARRPLAAMLGTLGLAAVLIVIVQRMFPADIGAYVGYFRDFHLRGLALTAERYWGVRGIIIGSALLERHAHLAALLEAGFTVLAAIGFLLQAIRRRMSVFEWFFVGYLMFLVIYPISIERDRYSLPIWPLAFLYCACGAAAVMQWLPRYGKPAFAGGLLAVTAGCYALQYARAAQEPVTYSVSAPESQTLFAAIRSQVPAGAVILARKPTTIALFTGRPATIWSLKGDDADLRRYMRERQVRYVVQERFPVVEFKEDQNLPLNGFLLRNPSALELTFSNAWYNLYRVRQL